MLRKILATCILCALAISSAYAVAPITLTDPLYPNSTATIDPYSDAGLFNWTVEMVDQMQQNSWYYRLDTSGAVMSLTTLGTPVVNVKTSNNAVVTYSNSSLSISVDYTLRARETSSGTADILTKVSVTNLSASAQSIQLFEILNLDLNATANNDTALYEIGNLYQQDGIYTDETAQVGPNGIPQYWEIGNAATLLNKIQSTSFTNLANASTPYTGDTAWAMQWMFSNVAKNGTRQVAQDLLIDGVPSVPEPGTIVSLCAGLLGIAGSIKRKR